MKKWTNVRRLVMTLVLAVGFIYMENTFAVETSQQPKVEIYNRLA